MSNERERRCADCGAPVTDEHLALAAETGQAPFCWECWGEHVVWVEGEALADLNDWRAFVEQQRRRRNGGWGEEHTEVCDDCGQRWLASDMGHSAYNGRPICPRCESIQQRAAGG